jgi:hypothetical protein
MQKKAFLFFQEVIFVFLNEMKNDQQLKLAPNP